MSFRVLLPKLKNPDDTIEVRKALADVEAKINEQQNTIAALESRIAALEGGA